jgi:CDP-paratose synthetase
MTKKVLLTGSRGFIGSVLKAHLQKKGYQVIGTHRISQVSAPDEILLRPFETIELEKHGNISAVIHLAGKYSTSGSLEDTAKMFESNVGLTASVLELVKAKGIPILAAGSFFEKSKELDLNLSPYVLAKSSARKILKYETLQSDIKVGIVFLYDNYSNNLGRGKFLDQVIKAAITGGKISGSSGHQVIDLMHIFDVCEALERALWTLENGELNYIEMQARSHKSHTLRQAAALIEDRVGREIVEWGVLPDRCNSIFSLWNSAPDVPNFQPKVELEDFLRETLDGN